MAEREFTPYPENLQRRYTAYRHHVPGVAEAIMLDVNVVLADLVRHYSIVLAGAAGWEVRVEEGRSIEWRETLQDWHRVERTIERVKSEVSDMLARGWTIQPVSR